MEFITPKELHSTQVDDLLILDIREQDRFVQGNIKGCTHIKVYNDIKAGNYEEVKEKLKDLPKDKKIITVCNAGFTAQVASKLLIDMGYKTAVLERGMMGWFNDNLPYEKV